MTRSDRMADRRMGRGGKQEEARRSAANRLGAEDDHKVLNDNEGRMAEDEDGEGGEL